MPRPGPRPYECIRRAWHSESHHTLRGSLIQEIFRVVNEIHSPTTRRKKEWQEKLPMVVLRAEEILYSKANSEAEYMDLKTVCSRLEDAVNTMIRRDESTEGGKFLEPCVEAALSLGCPPRKAPRGQRHNLRSCASSSRRHTAPSSVPVLDKCNNYGGSTSGLQAHIEESGSHTNAVYRAAVTSTYPSIDSQQYCIPSIPATPGYSGSVVCAPRADNLPSPNKAGFFYPNPCTTSHSSSLNFNRGGVPLAYTAPFVQQTFSGIPKEGRLLHLPQHQTRMETGLICMPVPWPLGSTSTSSAISTTWGIPTSFRPPVFDASTIALPPDANRTRYAAAETPTAYQDSKLCFQVPSMASEIRYPPQADISKDVRVLSHLDEYDHSMHSSCKDLQKNGKQMIGDSSMEGIGVTSTVNAYDLQLRLGPPGNPCTYVAMNTSCSADSRSSNSGVRAQLEDHSLKKPNVIDYFDSRFCKPNQEVLHYYSLENSGVDASLLRGTFLEEERPRCRP